MRLDRRSRNQGRIPRGDTRVAQVVLTVAHLALSFQRSRSKKEITCKAGGDWNLLVGSAAYLCRTDASWSAFLHSGSDLSRTFRRVLQRVVLSSTETCPALATCHSRPRETAKDEQPVQQQSVLLWAVAAAPLNAGKECCTRTKMNIALLRGPWFCRANSSPSTGQPQFDPARELVKEIFESKGILSALRSQAMASERFSMRQSHNRSVLSESSRSAEEKNRNRSKRQGCKEQEAKPIIALDLCVSSGSKEDIQNN